MILQSEAPGARTGSLLLSGRRPLSVLPVHTDREHADPAEVPATGGPLLLESEGGFGSEQQPGESGAQEIPRHRAAPPHRLPYPPQPRGHRHHRAPPAGGQGEGQRVSGAVAHSNCAGGRNLVAKGDS